MTTGEGIFWGLSVASLVALYLATRGHWKWRKILGWGAGLVCLLFVVAVSLRPATESFQRWQSKTYPERVTDLAGVRLGETDEELRLRLGNGVAKKKPDGTLVGRIYVGGPWERYGGEVSRVMVRLNRAAVVELVVVKGDLHMRRPGIPFNLGDSLAQVEEWWGEASSTKTFSRPYENESEELLSRLYVFADRGTFVEISNGEVVAIGIFADEAKDRINPVEPSTSSSTD